MITGTAKNPSYRMPTPRNSMSPPGATISSPKRKRSDSKPTEVTHVTDGRSTPKRRQTTLLSVETDGHSSSDLTVESASDSPRSRVADRLKALNFEPVKSLEFDARTSSEPRERQEPNFDLSSGEDAGLGWKLPPPSLQTPKPHASELLPNNPDLQEVNEIAETPALQTRAPSPPCVNKFKTRRKIAFVHIASPPPESKPAKLPSPPSPAPLTSHLHSTDDTDKSPISPLDLSTPTTTTSLPSPAPPTTDLTWQDSEITGHDIDVTSPDDDGEGINGIGFRPTPAVAWQRSQQRRQQVSEWRAREAREARQRRIERRKRRVSSPENESGQGQGTRKRVVRFAEVG